MYLFPKWVRLWHVINAILIIVLIITGISMQYTDKENTAFLMEFSKAVKWHNISASFLVANYVFFILGNAITGNGRYYKIPLMNLIPDILTQFRYYAYGKFRGEKHPFPVSTERKFNPLQRFTYFLAMYVAFPLLIISGFGLLFPETVINRFFGVSGLILTDILHISMGFCLSIFLVVHIYTCTLGAKTFSHFRSIITGYQEPDEI
ncbi:MAG: hypothetical protein GYA43_09155 [Bacteroidales bacterium]|nr:hypothetical protein [Bacteroidales bacterium]